MWKSVAFWLVVFGSCNAIEAFLTFPVTGMSFVGNFE
jgi:hypothetical protein